MNFYHSLLARYLLIIIAALCLWPLSLPIYYIPDILEQIKQQNHIYPNEEKLKQMWHQEASKLNKATSVQIDLQLKTIKMRYPKAKMFWVDAAGKTQLMLPKQENIPIQWTYRKSIEFIEKGTSRDPFTVISYIGGDPNQGFMVLQVPRSLMSSTPNALPNSNIFITIFINFLLAIFLIVSWLFFSKIRKRLVRLQIAMTQTDETGIPKTISVHKEDEIGKLELAFNRMIEELENSRKREQQEEILRKQLISNISHDLRTPLTTIRGHAYSLQKEPLSTKGKNSLLVIENKVESLSQLIDNLLSYTLLSAGKYPMQKQQTDMVRMIRSATAAWYPVFEKEGFEVDVCLLEKPMIWNIDPLWFARIMDNLFQNITRHAYSGGYVGVYTEESDGCMMVVIKDKGPGMTGVSHKKGLGIGLSIVSLMLEEMNLEWEIDSSADGTNIFLFEKI